MPRMSRKRREEWGFFLNHRNRMTYVLPFFPPPAKNETTDHIKR